MIELQEKTKNDIDDMFQFEEVGDGDQSAAPLNYHRPQVNQKSVAQ